MKIRNQAGSASSVALIVILSLLLIGSTAFGVWAYRSRQDYKNNTDAKIATAVTAANAVQAAQLQQKFNEDYKNPNKVYQGSATFGTISFKYPKTWSAYVDETGANEPLSGYFYPDKVPGLNSTTAFALRVELVTDSYSQVLTQFGAQIKLGKVKASAYVPPLMNGVANLQTGTRFDGVVNQNQAGEQTGSMIVIPVRDKTLKIYTESDDFLPDFNNIVLASLKFVP